ncbi:hypothetical protein MKW92_022797 [Papaver armeniacum]|nr:hypothetical protein MKW92_022797 [Papaver armeniacum]
MERYSIDAITSNGNMSQRAMLNSSVAAAGNNNNPPRPSYPCPYPLKPQSRVASFSTYLPPKDQKQESNVADSEINIFEAERYFNDIQDQKELNKNVSPPTASLGRVCVYRNDETSMANPRLSAVSSLMVLRLTMQGILEVVFSIGNKENCQILPSSSSSKWFFGRKCSCTEVNHCNSKVVQLSNTSTGTSFKKQSFSSVAGEDVYVKQEVVPVMIPMISYRKRWNRSFSNDTGGAVGGGAVVPFHFPILNAPVSATTKANFNGGKPPISLRKSTDLQRRVLMSFPEESDRRSFNYPGIESSTQSTMFPMYRRRDLLDETSSYDGRRYGGIGAHFRRSLDETTPSIAPTECYEPSERVCLKFLNCSPLITRMLGFMNNIDTKMSTQSTSNRKGAGLFSCRYEKAVNVGPHPVKRVSPSNTIKLGGRTMDRNSLQKEMVIN